MDDKELVEVWRKQFESTKSESAIQRDYRKPELYWNDPVQHQWEGFILAKRSQPSVVLPRSKWSPILMVHFHSHSDISNALTAAGIKYTIGE